MGPQFNVQVTNGRHNSSGVYVLPADQSRRMKEKIGIWQVQLLIGKVQTK